MSLSATRRSTSGSWASQTTHLQDIELPASRQLELSMAPDLLIVVCEEGCAACPYLPQASRIVRWPFDEPTELSGDQRVDALRAIAGRLEELSTELTGRDRQGEGVRLRTFSLRQRT